MLVDKRSQRRGPYQRCIAAKNKRLTLKISKVLFAAQHGMACALLLGLLDKNHIAATFILFDYLLFAVADHHDNFFNTSLAAGIQNEIEHRPSAYLVQNFRPFRFHTRALTRRQYYRNTFRHELTEQ